MNAGDIISIKNGHPYESKMGIIIERTFEIMPPGTHRILVYKVLIESMIINVPYKWLQLINTHQTNTGEQK